MAMHPNGRASRRAAPSHRARRADLSYAAYARDMPPPRDRIEAALRRLDYLVWRLGRRGGTAPPRAAGGTTRGGRP